MRNAFMIIAALVLLNSTTPADILIEMDTPLGPILIRLFNEDKPVTVSNFLNYVESGRYQDMFFHRAVSNFVVQGGGFYIEGNSPIPVTTDPPITNEYNVGRQISNTYGTMAMARVGGQTNSATSQFFFNLKDNSFLDSVDGGFTVFGEVVEGTNVLEFFKHIPPTNTVNLGGAFTDLPVQHYNLPPLINDLYFVDVHYPATSITRGTNTLPSIRIPAASGMTTVVQQAETPAGPWTIARRITNSNGYITLPITNEAATSCFRFYQVR